MMNRNKKIIFIGSVGTGKSTIVKNLSSVPVLSSEVDSTVDIGKKTTTVGIDFGVIYLSENERISLYGVPGQRKYAFVIDHVIKDCWGTVILVKNNCVDSIKEMEFLLGYLDVTPECNCVVSITHCDISSSNFTKKRIQQILNKKNLSCPVYSIDTSLKRNANLIIQTLTALEETGFER